MNDDSDLGIQPSTSEVADAVAVAAGRRAGTLLLTNARIVNVFTNEIVPGDVLVAGRLIAAVWPGLGSEDHGVEPRRVIDLAGAYVAPGLIDGHVHLESSLVTPEGYARAVLPRGVTGVVCDPHEIANVAGESGVEWLLDSTTGLPFDVWVTVPSCVPSSAFETAGAELPLEAMERLLRHPRVVGVAEMMSFPDVVAGDATTLLKVAMAEQRRLPAEGHAPGLSGRALQAYLASGIGSDHESTTLEEAREKLRAGAFLMVREGSVTRDLAALMPLVEANSGDRIGFVTDDRLPHDLLTEGGVDHLVRSAIAGGVDPAYAVRCATINNAAHYRLLRRGAVAPGYFADLVVCRTLTEFQPSRVYKDGALVARDGDVTALTVATSRGPHRAELASAAAPTTRNASRAPLPRTPNPLSASVNPSHVTAGALRIDTAGLQVEPGGPTNESAARAGAEAGKVRCIVALENKIITRTVLLTPTVADGAIVADPARDILKLVCAERHGRNGRVGVGLVSGFGLVRGALASSVGHDHHNLMVLGAADDDMLTAIEHLRGTGGGLVVVDGGRVVADLPLPLAGLITAEPLEQVREALDVLDEAAAALGNRMPSPFMTLSFLGLPVIPSLRLTDMGLVDVEAGRLVSLVA